ncbi:MULTISPECIES: citramalate synthase [Rhodomicrobium]|uniref:citramalate synthase n=1 Tax=Rhodomicrobium TaxID=1068 RepID=UPI000B4B1429|nr:MULTISPECIES: citramalate synthase [Rhodomicrobium]
MSKERLYLFDTTLRDGAQAQGVTFSLDDKLLVARTLGKLGLDYIEGGYPGANPTDTAFFAEKRTFSGARLTAFGMTKRAGRSASNDPGFGDILKAEADAVCLVGKSSAYHVQVALGVSKEENLDSIADSVRAVTAAGRESLIDCEHFFDGFKADPDYALACARTAYEAGARWVVLCDTNGGTLPHEIEAIIAEVARHVPGDHLGIHSHNDTENAVAVTLAAIRAGVRHVQGTLNGIGERCGNANLTSIIPTLLLKPDFADRFETGITLERLKWLTHASRLLDEVLNRAPNRAAAYVGESAFAHKGGIHVSAVQKDTRTYEHVPPEAIGNSRKLLVSNQAGRSNIVAELERIGLNLRPDDPHIAQLLEEVKRRESIGYAYEAADASFELLARRALGEVPEFFRVDSFRVMVERRHNALGQLVTISEATVKVHVAGQMVMNVGEGNGPVHALDQALRRDLGKYQDYIRGIELVDYKVRILTGGTDAVTRVLIETLDRDTGERWFTVGVSPNIVDASFEALLDSITYKLLKNKAPAPEALAA